MKSKKQIISYAGIGILFFLLLVMACNSNRNLVATNNSIIIPPFKGIDVAFNNYEIKPGTLTSITTSTGTKITIPANALIDSTGKPIEELCEINYREFMDQASILTSGIPMGFKNSDANINKNFTSAGMCEINGRTKSGKEIFISSNNPITVDLATNNQTSGYSNFYLKAQTGEWIYCGEEKIMRNEEKVKLNKEIDKLRQTTAFAGKNYFVLNTSTMLDIYFKDDNDKIYRYYEKRGAKLPKRLLQYGIKSSELYTWSSAYLGKNEENATNLVWENISGRAFPKWTKGCSAEIERISGNIHNLKIYNNKKDTFQTKIQSVMRIKHLFAFDPEYWTKSYDEAMKQIEEDEKRIAAMKDVYRTLEVNKFGVYNCDKFYNVPEAFVVKANFVLPKGNETFIPEKIYYISKKDNSLISYDYHKGTEVTLSKDPTAVLITILSGNVLAEVSSKDLMAVNGNKSQKLNQTFTFHAKEKISSQEDIQKYFDSLN